MVHLNLESPDKFNQNRGSQFHFPIFSRGLGPFCPSPLFASSIESRKPLRPAPLPPRRRTTATAPRPPRASGSRCCLAHHSCRSRIRSYVWSSQPPPPSKQLSSRAGEAAPATTPLRSLADGVGAPPPRRSLQGKSFTPLHHSFPILIGFE
jgi:hypothetical protein